MQREDVAVLERARDRDAHVHEPPAVEAVLVRLLDDPHREVFRAHLRRAGKPGGEVRGEALGLAGG